MDRLNIDDDEHCDLVGARIVSRSKSGLSRQKSCSVFVKQRVLMAGGFVVACGLLALFHLKSSVRSSQAKSSLSLEKAGPDEKMTIHTTVRTWSPRFLDEYPLAVCNDGSPAAYYYRPGTPETNSWVVFLEGAGWCWDKESCSAPWHAKLGTSHLFPRTTAAVAAWTRSLEGIFDATGRSPIRDMNIAFVRTCSNDAFMGHRAPTEPDSETPGASWHFRGKAIVEAVFADLSSEYGLGDDSSHRVIFGGCSSGARGAMVMLDHVANELAGQASVVGLLDSPVWVPIDPLAKTVVSFQKQTQEFSGFANASGIMDDECKDAYSEETWKCIMGAYRLPFVKTPYFLTQSQYDLFSVSMNAIGHFAPFVPLSKEQKDFADQYRHMLVSYLPTPTPGSGNTVYSTACYTHCSVSSHIFYRIQSDGVGLWHVLQQWLTTSNQQLKTGYIVDRCDGFNCGQRKPVQTNVPTPAPQNVEDDDDMSLADRIWHYVSR